MSKSTNSFREYWGKKDVIEQLIWVTAIALLVVVGSFSAYYYFDRYVAEDISPKDLEISEVEALIRDNPSDPNLRMALIERLYGNGEYKKVIQQAYEVLDLYGDEYDAVYFFMGMSNIQLENNKEAIPVLERFVELRGESEMANLDPLFQTSLYYLGNIHFEDEDYEAAIPFLIRALEANYTDADSMYILGQAYAYTGQQELALAQYHEAIRFVPNFYEVYAGMIESYTVLDQPDKVAYARGMQLFYDENFESAVAHLYSSYETDPDFVPNLLGLGMTYERLGDYDFALLYLNEALQRDPDNFMANNVVGRIQLLIQEDK